MNYFIVIYSDRGIDGIIDIGAEMELQEDFLIEKLKDPGAILHCGVCLESLRLRARYNSHRNMRVYAFSTAATSQTIEELLKNDKNGMIEIISERGVRIA